MYENLMGLKLTFKFHIRLFFLCSCNFTIDLVDTLQLLAISASTIYTHFYLKMRLIKIEKTMHLIKIY